MIPTLRQRLGLTRPFHAGDKSLLAARAGFVLFAGQALLVGAATLGEGARAPLGATAAGSCAIAFLVIALYERLSPITGQLLAAADAAIIAMLILVEPYGELYFEFFVWPSLYAVFFFPALRAALLVAWIGALSGVAVSVGDLGPRSTDVWFVHMAVLTGAAGLVFGLRRSLGRLLTRERETRAQLDTIFENAPVGLSLLDGRLRRLRANGALSRIAGGGLLGDVAPVVRRSAERVLRTGEPEIACPVTVGERHLLVSHYPVKGAHGCPAGVVAVAADVTELREAQNRLEELLAAEHGARVRVEEQKIALAERNSELAALAATDALTDLPNRRMLVTELELALARARRTGLSVAVLALDVDRLKWVNDTLGHDSGDELLRAVAKRLRKGSRQMDLVARVGGDEFVVLLSDLDPTTAREEAERVAARIADHLGEQLVLGPIQLSVTASTGIALYPDDAGSRRDLLARADEAMYERKRTTVDALR